MNILRRAWLDYEHTILDPIKADRIQRQETRRAFYCGAQSVFGGILSNLTPGEEPQEADLTMLSDVQAEIDAFTALIKAGRA